MNSFNVYGQTSETIGGNTPIWLGTVKPIPVGATFTAKKGLIKAGTAAIYDPESKMVAFIESFTGSGAGMLETANAYLYNDINNEGEAQGDTNATCALVMHHPEGLMIERVYPEITEEQIAALQAKIPGVLLVRG